MSRKYTKPTVSALALTPALAAATLVLLFASLPAQAEPAAYTFSHVATLGQPAPGGTYRLAFGPVLNNRGQIAFIGDLSPAPGFGNALGVSSCMKLGRLFRWPVRAILCPAAEILSAPPFRSAITT